MARTRKAMTKEEADARIEQLEAEVVKLTDRIKTKKVEIARLKQESKRLEQDRLLKLVMESGKDYSELVEILGR
jgi:predicted  nucleic acid-binding Zn-ribbon protein